jgi:hypothetical protein
VSQPRWVVHSGGRCTLLYLSDKADGWWNIHKAELQIDTQVDVDDSIPLLVSPVLLCKGMSVFSGSLSNTRVIYNMLDLHMYRL